MYSRAYPEKPMQNTVNKKETALPENYSGTMMRCEVPEAVEQSPCPAECEVAEECVKTPQEKKSAGLFGGDDDLLLLGLLLLLSGREKGENDLMLILGMLFVGGIL